MESTEIVVEVEKEHALTPGRIAAVAALAAGVVIAAWSAIHAAKTPKLRARAHGFADAAKRIYDHPDRVARGNGKAMGLRMLETFGNTAAKVIAGRLAIALFEMAIMGPERDVELVDFPMERIEPLPA